MWRDCFKLPDGWTPAQGQEDRGAGGGRGRGRGGRGGSGGGAASMKSTGNESESRDDRFPSQFFFVSTQASAGPEKDEGFEEPAAVGKVTLHSLDYWVIDSGATYSMTPRADLLTELEPSPVKHVTSALGQRAEVKGMGKAMFKGADGKMVGLKNFTRFPFSSSEATAKAPLDEVVMDVVGPLKLGAAGAEYFLTIVDVFTRMTWVYVLSMKSDVAETVKTDWLPMVERQQDRLVKAIRTDRGEEFLGKEFGLWLKKNGIRHFLTMPYSPAMNGIAERANRTITETARGLLIEAGLPDYFWPDAVRSACVAKNRALTHVGADKWVPYVEWIGRKPKVDMLRVFGCMCMALVPKHLRHNKLGAKAIWASHVQPGGPRLCPCGDGLKGHCLRHRYAGSQVGAEDSAGELRLTKHVPRRHDEQHLVAGSLQLYTTLLQLSGLQQVCLYTRNVEDVGDEHLLPSLSLQSDGPAALNGLQRPIEAAHVLDVGAQPQNDEDLLCPHLVVQAGVVEQNLSRV
ncbi:unnamed protein product [Closterium sp. NIES-53]